MFTQCVGAAQLGSIYFSERVSLYAAVHFVCPWRRGGGVQEPPMSPSWSALFLFIYFKLIKYLEIPVLILNATY